MAQSPGPGELILYGAHGRPPRVIRDVPRDGGQPQLGPFFVPTRRPALGDQAYEVLLTTPTSMRPIAQADTRHLAQVFGRSVTNAEARAGIERIEAARPAMPASAHTRGAAALAGLAKRAPRRRPEAAGKVRVEGQWLDAKTAEKRLAEQGPRAWGARISSGGRRVDVGRGRQRASSGEGQAAGGRPPRTAPVRAEQVPSLHRTAPSILKSVPPRSPPARGAHPSPPICGSRSRDCRPGIRSTRSSATRAPTAGAPAGAGSEERAHGRHHLSLHGLPETARG